MNCKTYIIILLGVLLTSYKSSAQWMDISKEEYILGIKTAEEYFGGNSQAVRFRYSVFAGHNASNAHESYEGFYIRKDDELFSSTKGQSIYQNSKKRLIADNESKKVILTVPDTQEDSEIKNTIFKSTLNSVKSFQFRIENGKKTYKLNYNGYAGIDYQLIVLNSKGLVESFETYYAYKVLVDPNNDQSAQVKPCLKMELYAYDFQIEISADNKLETVLKTENGKNFLIGKLKGFELINVLN